MYLLALADNSGDLYGEPGVAALGRSGKDMVPISEEDWVLMPYGSTVSLLVDRVALGRDSKKKSITVKSIEGDTVYPAAAVLPPGYTRTYLPAYETKKKARDLPFFAYTAISISDEQIYCAAVRTHDDFRWDPVQYSSLDLPGKIKRKLKTFKNNRLYKHLSQCSTEYSCFTAQNIFYERWEGGIPTSPGCNANCGGCISESRLDKVPSPQTRIPFIPTVDEITEVAVNHLKSDEAIISFGQGCEGEPLMQGKLIADSIQKIRSKTDLGTININSNGSLPEMMGKLIDAGLDSARISLNSAIPDRYEKYFKPSGYTFQQVLETIKRLKDAGKFVSVNYLFLPGVNDKEDEKTAFFRLLEEYSIDMIQFRNLNIDPDYYFRFMPAPAGRTAGVRKYIEEIREKFPQVVIGNFSIPVIKNR
ncbi:MAG: radical SAM protein [Firmicutes bacterium]|nr:radical SAM protein [Bacillota bacterium]